MIAILDSSSLSANTKCKYMHKIKTKTKRPKSHSRISMQLVTYNGHPSPVVHVNSVIHPSMTLSYVKSWANHSLGSTVGKVEPDS